MASDNKIDSAPWNILTAMIASLIISVTECEHEYATTMKVKLKLCDSSVGWATAITDLCMMHVRGPTTRLSSAQHW